MAEEKEPAQHGGAHAVAAARMHGASTMFTLSGGHVFPLYDGAVKADPPMRMVDVRHEQTAVFRLMRLPAGADETQPAHYLAGDDGSTVEPVPVPTAAGTG